MHKSVDFQPRQIVSLESGLSCLYGEVIQVVVARQMCWVRPLMLVARTEEPSLLTDLRCCADLVLPSCLFQPAVDTEVLLPLTQLLANEPPIEADPVAKKQLHQFIREVWNEYKSAEC